MPVVLQVPDEPGGEPVVVVAVYEHGLVGADPASGQEFLQLLFGEEVADRPRLEVRTPVQADGAPDMARVVGTGVDVDLDDLHVRVIAMLDHPGGVHQHLGMGVARPADLGCALRHANTLLKLTKLIDKLNKCSLEL